jgi:hypothetical protein
MDSAGHLSKLAFSRLATALLFCSILNSSSSANKKKEQWSVGQKIDANVLAREVVQNELNAQDTDKSLWSFREVDQEKGVTKLDAVVQCKEGEIHRLLSINGHPLNPEQKKKERERLQRILVNRGEFQAKQKDHDQDAQQERKLLKMLPQAFRFQNDGMVGGNIKLTFTPNKSFHSFDRESSVLSHMQGMILVNPKASQNKLARLAEIDGRLNTEVTFWHGLLGHLDKGGTFTVKQNDVGDGHWEMTLLNVNMHGKALFFKTIAVREKQIYSDYQSVPENTTLEQAVRMIEELK